VTPLALPLGAALALALCAAPAFAAPDTLRFTPDPTSADTLRFLPESFDSEDEIVLEPESVEREEWLRAPFGDRLLTDVDVWRSRGEDTWRLNGLADYNRVDRLRLGVGLERQEPETLLPRLGARIEYAIGRDRTLYGMQVEQPLLPPGRLTLGVSMSRVTGHSDLQQVEDSENSLAMLFGRQDYRDYFEREGLGAFVAWRVPDFSTVSVHVRNDEYASLPLDRGVRSWFHRDRDLRDNPAVDEGEIHALLLRLERLAHRTSRTRAGLYHWIEVERAGGDLGGDFRYTRLLADVRSVLRLSPSTTLSLRGVGGFTPSGTLPFQKTFTVGGVDGLRAHRFAQYRGNQMLLAQAEYTIGLWRMTEEFFEGGLTALVFADAGRAWTNPDHGWDLERQHVEADGGFGLGTAEEGLRIYFARNLQDPDSEFAISVRLQRPF
jgi:hypothetical protein